MAIARLGKLSYEFEEEELECENLPEISSEDAKAVLFKTQDVFSKFGIDVYLTYGTLLGAVRDQAIIPGDLDVDVFIKDEKKMFQHLQEIEEGGLKLIRAFNKTYSFRLNNNPNCFIDVYIMRPTFSVWGLYCYGLEIVMVPKKYVQEGEIAFMGRTFKCPKNPERILKFWYGDTWNVPISKNEKTYTYDVPTHYYYAKYLLQAKIKMRSFIGDRFYDAVKSIIGKKK